MLKLVEHIVARQPIDYFKSSYYCIPDWSCGLQLHLFADDTQIVGSCRPCDTAQLQSHVSECFDDVGLWMRSNCMAAAQHEKDGRSVVCAVSLAASDPG